MFPNIKLCTDLNYLLQWNSIKENCERKEVIKCNTEDYKFLLLLYKTFNFIDIELPIERDYVR